jgi:hypothetical protein
MTRETPSFSYRAAFESAKLAHRRGDGRVFTIEFNSQDWRALPAQMQTRILDSARSGNPKSRLLRNLLDAANLLERLWSS